VRIIVHVTAGAHNGNFPPEIALYGISLLPLVVRKRHVYATPCATHVFRRHQRTPTHDAGAGEQDAEEVVKEFAEHALRERIIVSIVIIVTIGIIVAIVFIVPIVFIVSKRGMGIINIGLYQEEIKIQPDVGLF
jgi:hypothetical protein